MKNDPMVTITDDMIETFYGDESSQSAYDEAMDTEPTEFYPWVPSMWGIGDLS